MYESVRMVSWQYLAMRLPSSISVRDGTKQVAMKVRVTFAGLDNRLSRRHAGDQTTVEQATLTNNNLGAVGRAMGLDRRVISYPCTTSVSNKTIPTTVEAISGAVYLDGGMEALTRVKNVSGLTTRPFLEAVMFNLLSPLFRMRTDTSLLAN